MTIGYREALIAIAILFVGFLVVKMRPLSTKRAKLTEAVREARARAYAATTPRDRASALCEAGVLAAGEARWTAAAGFFLRAMNADTAWPEAIERASETLMRKRPRLLEKILWRRLSHIPWDAEHTLALKAATLCLERLYEEKIRDANRAEFLRRFERTL